MFKRVHRVFRHMLKQTEHKLISIESSRAFFSSGSCNLLRQSIKAEIFREHHEAHLLALEEFLKYFLGQPVTLALQPFAQFFNDENKIARDQFALICVTLE